jgi:hypothetical protein
MNRPRGPRASYLVASVRTLADELERAIAGEDLLLQRALRDQLAEQLDALSLLLREENSAR